MKKAKIFSLMLLPFAEQYIVMLEEESSGRLIPIWIGINEGNAIALHLNGDRLPRPCTHDLLASVIAAADIRVQKVVITDLADNTYYACLVLERDDEVLEIDSRPSDALALAVRTGAPVFIDELVLEKCPVIKKPISDDEVSSFRSRLETMKPEDFFKEIENMGDED